MDEADFHVWKASDNVIFYIGCVESLFGDAVAVKDDSVTVMQGKRRVARPARERFQRAPASRGWSKTRILATNGQLRKLEH